MGNLPVAHRVSCMVSSQEASGLHVHLEDLGGWGHFRGMPDSGGFFRVPEKGMMTARPFSDLAMAFGMH